MNAFFASVEQRADPALRGRAMAVIGSKHRGVVLSQRIILKGGSALEIAQQAQREGVSNLRQSGLLKVKQGMTSVEEVLGCTND